MRDVPIVACEGTLQAVINNDADHVLQAKMQESSALVANARNFQEVVGTDGSTYYVNTATQETIVEKPEQIRVLEATMAEMADAAVRQREVSHQQLRV